MDTLLILFREFGSVAANTFSPRTQATSTYVQYLTTFLKQNFHLKHTVPLYSGSEKNNSV